MGRQQELRLLFSTRDGSFSNSIYFYFNTGQCLKPISIVAHLKLIEMVTAANKMNVIKCKMNFPFDKSNIVIRFNCLTCVLFSELSMQSLYLWLRTDKVVDCEQTML